MRRATAPLLALGVGVVLADSAIVTLALPDILRELHTTVTGVAWVLIAFNLVLALVAVPAARLLRMADPVRLARVGLVVFAIACATCAFAPTLGVLIGARCAQAVGGALVVVTCLDLLVHVSANEAQGVTRWAIAGVVGAATGPVAGGLLTAAISWQAIFVVQVPLILAVVPAVRGLQIPRAEPDPRTDRPHVIANVGLALLSAALTAALFLLVLLLVEGWRRSPAVAAVTVTVVPVAALVARPLARAFGSGARSENIAGSLLIAGGLAALALLPHADLVWTVGPQALVGLGLGLTVDSLTATALRDRAPRALQGGWTIAARHAGVVVGLLILTPVFSHDLASAQTPAKEAVAGLVLDAPLRAQVKVDLARGLAKQLDSDRGRVPDAHPAFTALHLSRNESVVAAKVEHDLDDQLRRAATRAFRNAFLIASALALLAAGFLLPWKRSR